MLFESLYAPHSGVNIQQVVMSLSEDLDVPSLERAWQVLAGRHEVLRTSFQWARVEPPLQQVAPAVSIPFQLEDLRPLAREEREARIQAYLRQDRFRGFDLSEAPLMRVVLFRLGAASYEAVWTCHHILLDGRSTTKLLRELFTLYEGLRKGEEPGLDTPRPYREFIDWLARRDVDSSREYWSSLLEGFTGPTPFGVDKRVQPALPLDPERGRQRVRLPEALARALRAFAENSGLTLNTLVQGAWAILLSRYSGEQDVVFGATRACRGSTVEGSDQMVGLFINTVPVRARFNADTELLPFLRALRSQSLAVRPHEHTPLVRIKEWSGFPPAEPLFESIVVFEKYEMDEALRAQGGAWSCREFRTHQQTSYPLSLAVLDGKEPLVTLVYDRRRFADDAVRRLLGHFQTILDGMARPGTGRIAELPMLTEPERRRMLFQWNDTAKDYPVDGCIHHFVEAQAERTPNAVAAMCAGVELSYRELNRRANQLAHLLRSMGVGPDLLVGLCTERSLEMLVGLLGILKAGGAYVPMDPSYPKEGLAFLVEDAGIGVVVTMEEHLPKLPVAGVRAICLDRDRNEVGQGGSDNARGAAAAGNLAYVIYTSGSTGKPKGAMVEHRSVLNYVFGIVDRLQLDPGMSYAMVQPLTVDSSVTVLYSSLFTGGCLHLIPKWQAVDPSAVAEYFARHAIDCLKIAPSHLAALLSGGPPQRILPRRRLVIGGESSRREWAESLLPVVPGCAVFNHYGPTEATVGVTTYGLDAGGCGGATPTLPIGRPLPNVKAYILGSGMRPVPIGVPGELYLGGLCLARGYLNRPEQTAACFVANPFDGEGTLLYRTGDLVRYLEDGNIEFLGRKDHQVKIRGFRVEPGEIESVLGQHPGVREAVVTPWKDRLAAFVAPRGRASLDLSDVRAFLRDRLPDHMIPASFNILKALPRTPHGKLDRKALPVPQEVRSEPAESLVVVRDGVEVQLAKIWERVLGIRPVGPQDSFFELGGHSLLAVSLFAEMEKVFGVRLPLATLFQAPTVERLAERLRGQNLLPVESSLVPIQPRGSRPPFFAVHGHGGNVLFYRELARHLGDDQPFYGFQSPGLDGREDPLGRVDDMVARYLREMRAVQPGGPYYLGGFCIGAYVALAMARQLEADGEAVGLLVSFATDGSWRDARSVREQIALHLGRLSRLGTRAKAAYVGQRLQFRRMRIGQSLAALNARVLLRMKRPLPAALRYALVRECNYQANRKHVACPFGGAVVYFQPDAALTIAPHKFWSRMAKAGLDVHVVPGVEEDIFHEPNVACLARALHACLDKAQGAAALT